ncbi:carbon-nitrogen hydrolase [Trichoderma sp. SZMC 28013]
MTSTLQKLRIATAQVHTLDNPERALQVLETKVRKLSSEHVDLVLFPEVFIGGFPRLSTFGGSAIGSFGEEKDYSPYMNHWRASVDLGDTPRGAGQKWIRRELPLPANRPYRGDGTRERLEKIAAATGVFIIVGILERCGGTLYSSIVYICPRLGIIGKRRKVMPTGLERVAWGQGSPSTLEAVSTVIRGVKLRMSAAICWENWMPLLRQSIYEQNINLFLGPTAHATEIWVPLMQTIGVESRAFVLSATPCIRANDLPKWITESAERGDQIVSRGGSVIVSPNGNLLGGPGWDQDDEIFIAEVDFADCEQSGDGWVRPSRARRDAFEFTVDGLDMKKG